ncbi:MAG: S1C family serine protease [Phycisphaerae bacterium]|nr:S1C family serine protease [Phycisphaerae bacterium]
MRNGKVLQIGRRLARYSGALALCLCLGLVTISAAPPPPKAADGLGTWATRAPRSVEDLRRIQKQLQGLLPRVNAATVGVVAGRGQGSGVIVSPDGFVLTAGHVSGQPNRQVSVILPSGRRVKAKTLGAYPTADAGMIKITEPGKWPHVDMGRYEDVKLGQWCFALGYPGGFVKERGAVVRIGRIISKREHVLWSDCTLLGGDSGGPLFDLAGRVVGIHSRISVSTEANFHAPVSAYRQHWDRLAAGEVWTGVSGAFLGVATVEHQQGVLVERVVARSSAAKAGVQAGDVLLKIDKEAISGPEGLFELVQKRRIDQKVKLQLLRDGKKQTLDVVLGRRPTQ